MRKKVLVTGGAGYVGSKLVPLLMQHGYEVSVIDIAEPLNPFSDEAPDTYHRADIRNAEAMKIALTGQEYVIHLACVSNDPSFDMDRELGKSINYDCFRPIVKAAKAAGVKRFIFASSSSVYGVKDTPDVTEDLPLDPMTDYALYKMKGEEILHEEREEGFETVIIRPATVCGDAPGLRLDLAVHILTMQALRDSRIRVFGGSQFRPNIHIDDICAAYLAVMEAPASKVDGEVFNVGHTNLTIAETAELIRGIMNEKIEIETTPTNDKRSYHVSSAKIASVLGFIPQKTVKDAVIELKLAYNLGRIPNPDDDKYYAIRRLKKMGLKP